MSFLTRAPLRLRSSLPLSRLPAARTFTVGARAQSMSEDDIHKDKEDRHAEIDAHKEDSLRKQKDGKGHWKNELASQSEAAVKADREEIHASDATIQDMQKQSEEILNKARSK